MSSLGVSSSLLQIDEPKHQTKHFRQLLVVASSRHISSLLVPSAAAWSRFWTLSLTLVQRNVTYRWLHGKANTRALMSLYDPLVYQPACILCLSCDETVEHLFFECPSKFAFWTALIQEFLWPGTAVSEIRSALTTLNFGKLVAGPSCPYEPALISIIAISELWKAHWRFAIQGQRFHPANVVACTSTALQKRFAEDHLSELE
ncbi:hypothetical protein [Parasitella parasitica]|uniref:Reverse transcriptase zinc-binding domain-containing protein n=1 Tax=Parasitella parasitica TaxID=35722 RepID=A0A0B7NHY3_9FUNG|nr:hypothetical protein [Parasitella parasitica]